MLNTINFSLDKTRDTLSLGKRVYRSNMTHNFIVVELYSISTRVCVEKMKRKNLEVNI